MNELQIKKELMIGALDELNLIDLFEIDTLESGKTIVFKSIHNLEKSKGIVFLTINETVYSTATIYFYTLNNISKKEKVLNLINDLNIKYKNSKYFINNENEIGVDVVYIATAKNFDAELFIKTFQTVCDTLIHKTYHEFMIANSFIDL